MSDAMQPPTTDSFPIAGDGFAFSRDPVAAMERWASHGDLVRLKVPGMTMYQVTDPELIERILVDEFDRFSIGPSQRETFSGVEDHAVTTNTGDRWKRLRRALHPAFRRDRVQAYGDRMAATTAAFVDEWNDGESFDLRDELRRLTVNVLADALLDVDARGDEDLPMAAADALVDRANFGRPGQLLPDWVPTPTDRRFARTVEELDDYVAGIVDRRRVDDPGDRTDVCSILLAAHEEGELTLDEVRHNLVALLLAGHDSPSLALLHAVRLLDDHPDVRAGLRQEYETVVDGAYPAGEDYDDLERTRNVVSETLRLFPPTTGVNRQATEALTLGDFQIPAGAQFLIPQWVPHRDPRWWEEPETFDPARWERDVDRPRFAYFPFSGGPRACVGGECSRRELVLALATIVGRVDVDVTMDGPLSFTPSIQLRPENEITARITRR